MNLEGYAEFCYDQVGGTALKMVPYFQHYKMTLTQANMNISLPEYISVGIFSVSMVSALTSSVLGAVLYLDSGLSGLITSLLVTLLISLFSVLAIYLYPKVIVANRRVIIRDMMPFATMYLSTLADTGTSTSKIFSKLSRVEEYDEIAIEARKISRDIETLGMDVSKALERGAERSPNKDFEDLLRGLSHVLTTGGSSREFLNQRSNSLMEDYERRVKEFADQLGLIVEMYITVVIVGSIIFTAMSAIMSSFTGLDSNLIITIQVLLVFFGLPVITAMFVILIRGISPGGVM